MFSAFYFIDAKLTAAALSTTPHKRGGEKIPPLAKGVRGICQAAKNPPVSPFFKGGFK
jgi:hypothetical protein